MRVCVCVCGGGVRDEDVRDEGVCVGGGCEG